MLAQLNHTATRLPAQSIAWRYVDGVGRVGFDVD